jgi:ABC-type branched-subunit amino acid transport system substrate-binding protein
MPLPDFLQRNMNRFFASGRLATLLGLLALPLPLLAAPSGKPIVIGHPADLSGPAADFNRDYALGAKVYFDYINGQGGVSGRRLQYRSADTGGRLQQGLSSAQALSEAGAQVLFGVSGDRLVDELARDTKLRSAGVSLFGVVGGSDQSSGPIHLRASRSDEIRAMIQQLASLGVVNFGLLVDSQRAAETERLVSATASELGARISASQRLDSNNPNAVDPAVKAISAARPQALIVIADTLAAAQVFQRYRQLDPGAFLCAPSEVNVRTLIAILGPSTARGLIVSQVVPNPSGISELAREHRKLMERYADEPASQATLEGYIAAKALVRSLQQREASPGEALRPQGKFDLGGFTLDFTSNQRASRFVELTVVDRNGRLLR